MKDSKKPTWPKNAAVAVIVGIALYTVISGLTSYTNDSALNCENDNKSQDLQEHTPKPEQTSVTKELLLKPGLEPQKIETNGRSIDWLVYEAGYEGQKIALIRFNLISGETTPWIDIVGKDYDKSDLPNSISTKSVEFGVPQEGSSYKIVATL